MFGQLQRHRGFIGVSPGFSPGFHRSFHRLPDDLWLPRQYKRHGDPNANLTAAKLALVKTGGNVKEAARLLGISRNALNSFLATHDR